MSLIGLDVTYATAMGAGKRLLFQKKRKESEAKSANIQTVKGGASVYLWASYSEALAEDAILEIRLLRGSDPFPTVPPGVSGSWKKIKRDLSAGKVKPLTFLAYRVGLPSEKEPPIVAVAVLRPEDKLGEFNMMFFV